MTRFVVLSLLLLFCVVVRILWSLANDVDAPASAADHNGSHEPSGMSADEELVMAASPLPGTNELAEKIRVPDIPFVDVTEESGLTFVHDRGLSDERLLPETMGSGCAVIDLNSDLLPDLLFVNARPWDWNQQHQDHDEQVAPNPTLSAWLNLGDLKFEDVTEAYGLDIDVYGMGAAVADFDNDDDPDIYITAVGENLLLRNDGDGFTDVSVESGTSGPADAWSTSAGWFDYDQDGDLDLFVGNYVEWRRDLEKVVDAITFAGDPRFGSPDVYPGDLPFLFRNNGAGEFTDVAQSVGLTCLTKTLGLAFFDANADGRLDVFVANDGVPDQLWMNSETGFFTDVAATAGMAFSSTGAARAGMGIDVADFRNNGSHAIAIGQYENEMTALFVSNDTGTYTDESLPCGLGRHSLPDLTWGVRFADFDLDGRQDLITVNGHVEQSDVHMFHPGRYEQSVALYWNAGAGTVRELIPLTPQQCGDDLFEPTSGRAMAVADFDGDGDLDLVTASSGKAVRLYRNELVQNSSSVSYLKVRLVGRNSNRDGIGAEVRVTAGGVTQHRLNSPARGYLSSSSPDLTFGLNGATSVESVEVVWPDGHQQSVPVSELNKRYVVHQQSQLKTVSP